MKLLNYEDAEGVRAGVVRNEMVFDVSKLATFENVRSIEDILRSGLLESVEREQAELTEGVPLESVRVVAPLRSPDKVLMVAANYLAHDKEVQVKPPEEPYFFTKFPSCIVSDGDPILVPRVSSHVDWEIELAFVMGKKGKYIRREDALGYIAGYTVANDVTFRDLQLPKGWPNEINQLGPNWVKGKALDGSLPLGPWLVTKDEIPNPQRLSLSLTVNDEQMQSGNTGDMVFGVDKLVEYLSNGITLLPGDLISTGTPAGVAGFTGTPFLKEGDVVISRVERVGTLSNTVARERD
jgi:2-keto-4-pentenoate hydratase/2-oxohepta-3-ene-1,7-dioic acid hydratase in catechol pathway